MSLAKLHRTMPTTVWIYPTCCHTFGKSPTNVKDFQKIPTNSKRFHYNLENSNFPGGQSLLGDFSYFYNTWQTECLLLKLVTAKGNDCKPAAFGERSDVTKGATKICAV